MQRIILDTNVLVSALIQKSYPFLILNDVFSSNNIQLCISDALMHEYYEVLNRRKFSRYPDFVSRAESLLSDIERLSLTYNPKIKLHIINDLADNRLLELADEANADFLITGNTNDFTMLAYKNTQIISSKDFYENNKPLR